MKLFSKALGLLSLIFFSFLIGLLIGEYNILEFRKTTYSFYSNGYQFYKSLNNKIEIPKMSLEIDNKSFEKIKNKRDSSLKNRYMTNSKKDYVPVNVFWNQKKKKGKLRLKGGFTDHYNDEKKWSFRIKLKKDSSTMMKSFALQHPKTRHYLNEWIFQQYIKFIGLINIDYDFIKLDLNGKDLGIYAMEESFTDRLLINKKLPIGPILKLDKGKFILDYKDECAVEAKDWFQYSNDEYLNAKIELYNEKNLEEDSAFSNSFKKARIMINKYRKNEILAHQLFDVNKMARYLVAINIFSGFHAVNWNNMRFYFNPKTSKLEPIAYDSNSNYYERISPEKAEKLFMSRYLYNDTVFFKAYMKELYFLSDSEQIAIFFESIKSQMQKKEEILSSEFFKFNKDINSFIDKAGFIRKVITNTFISDVSGCIEENYITVTNSNKFPVELLRIEESGKSKYVFTKNKILFSKVFLESPKTIKYNIPKDKYKLNSNKKVKLIYKIIGDEKEKEIKIEYFLCE